MRYPNAELSGYSQETATAFRITEDCNAGGGGGTVLQANIALGTCQSTITLSATQLDAVDSYTTCQLQKTGATFVAISDTTTDKIQYNLTTDGLLSYRIADTADADSGLTTGAITITANADSGYGFGSQSNTLTVTINGSVTALPKPQITSVLPMVSQIGQTGWQVMITPNFTDETNWEGAQWKYRVKNPDGTDLVAYTTISNLNETAINLTDTFLHAGVYKVDAEIVTSDGSSITGSTKVTDQTITINRFTASLSVAGIAHGTIDRDTLPDTKTASVTALNIDGDWSIETNADNADITVTKQSNNLQSVLDTDEIRAVDSNNVVTITATGTKWNQVLDSSGGLTPASNEVTATCTITATVTDALVFAWDGATPSDPVRDDRETDDSIPTTSTAYQFKQDNVNVTATLTGSNWQVKIGDGAWGTTVSGLNGSTDGTSPNIRFRYNSSAVVTDAVGTFTLSGVATNGESDPTDLVVNLRSTITQAIGTATFSGCSSIDAISIEVGETSNSTNNNKTCDLTTTDCSVPDKTATTLGIFTYTITNNTVKYWITNPSSIQSTTTETLAITATADTNFAFGGSSTKIINVTLSGTVSPKEATASAGSVTQITGTIGADWTDQEGTFDVTVANATIDNISAPMNVSTSSFNIKSNTASGNVYTYKYSLDAEDTTTNYGDKNTTYNITVKPTANSAFASQSTGQDYTLPVTLSANIAAGNCNFNCR